MTMTGRFSEQTTEAGSKEHSLLVQEEPRRASEQRQQSSSAITLSWLQERSEFEDLMQNVASVIDFFNHEVDSQKGDSRSDWSVSQVLDVIRSEPSSSLHAFEPDHTCAHKFDGIRWRHKVSRLQSRVFDQFVALALRHC